MSISNPMRGMGSVWLAEHFVLGRKVGKLVDAKFPSNTESHWKLGIYAAGRASQMRRIPLPRPSET